MKLIVNADDFGRSHEINQAIDLAWEHRILTSASLMVTGDFVQEAVQLAKQRKAAVGLHLTLTELRPALPIDCVPHLVDIRTGCFARNPAVVGWKIFWSRAARRELAAEMRAQFERFASLGIPLSHVDGHEHLHAHPVVLDLLLPLAEKFGARGVRLPREPLPSASISIRQRFYSMVFGMLSSRGANHLPDTLFSSDHTYGLMYTGKMDEPHVLQLIQDIRRQTDDCSEMYFHPTLGSRLDPLGANNGDLQALLSPRVKEALTNAGIELTTYPAAAAASVARPASGSLASAP